MNGRCRSIADRAAVDAREELFFRLSKYQKPLARHFQQHADFSEPRCAPQRAASDCSRAGSKTSQSAGPVIVGHSAARDSNSVV